MPTPAPSRILFLILAMVVFALASSWEHLLGDLPFGSYTLPVSLRIEGLQPADRAHIQVTYLPPFRSKDHDESPRDFESIATPQDGFSWAVPFRAIEQMHITAPAEVLHRIHSVALTIGDSRKSFDAAAFAAEWRPIPPFYEALDHSSPSVMTLAWPSHPAPGDFVNLRERRDIMMSTGLRAAVILAAGWLLSLLLIAVMRRQPSAARPAVPAGESAALWLAAGFAVFCAGIALARSRQPYAFTQDDNFSQFLPVILRSARELFQGRFPVWNPHQLLGAPTATVGIYMLTYPPTYLSYWLAQHLFRDPYLTLEIFIVLHLAAGYFITFFVLRRFGLRPSLAVAGALSFTLCAFLLIGGRSQATFVPIAVWLPLLAACLLALERGRPGWKWALATGAVIGIYYHAGHAQDWVYALMFFAAAIALLLLGERIGWSRALWCVPALAFGLALAAPLLLPQMVELQGRHFGSGGTGIGLLGMLLPLGPWVTDLRQPFSQVEGSGQLPYFGTTFAAAGFLGLAYYFYLLALCKLKRDAWRAHVGEAMWLLLLLLAVLLALGPDGVLWPLMANLPPFADFRWPNKLLPFVAFFAAVGGGMLIERWCSRRRPSRAWWLAAATMALVLLNTYWARAAWYTFADRPYPALNPSYAALIATGAPAGRILTRPQWDARSPVQGFFRTQALDFPTLTGALSLGGYDTFVEASVQNRRMLKRLYQDPVATARAYGVRWLVWDDLYSHPVFSPNPLVRDFEMPTMLERRALLPVRDQSSPALADDGVRLYRLEGADPLAFVDVPARTPLPVRFDMRGATVQTAAASAGAAVVVNVLWRPWMKAFADGRAVACHADSWGRVVVPLPQPARTLEVFYCPPWLASSLAGLGIAILGGAFGWLLKKRERRPTAP